MADDLTSLAESSIDAAIRSFDPSDENSFTHWDAELRQVELRLLEAVSLPDRQLLLGSVRAQRIGMAFDNGKYDSALEQSTRFVHETPVGHPSFYGVAIIRARSLHQSGAHEEESRELLELVRQPEIQGSEYIFLLEHLAKRHPGSVPRDERLLAKMLEAISALRAMGYDALQSIETEREVERLALAAAGVVRSVNRSKGKALLEGS